MKRIIKYGMSGNDVKEVQQKLKDLGYLNSICNGHFNKDTFKAVSQYQHDLAFDPDGVITMKVWNNLFNTKKPTKKSKFKDKPTYITPSGLCIYGEFDKKDDDSDYKIITLKLNCGTERPDIYSKIGNSTYVIGGFGRWDGKVYKSKLSDGLSICMCNRGKLYKIGGEFYDVNGNEVDENQVCKIEDVYYQRYTQDQINSLNLLLKHLLDKYNIKVGYLFDIDWYQNSVSCNIKSYNLHPDFMLTSMLNNI